MNMRMDEKPLKMNKRKQYIVGYYIDEGLVANKVTINVYDRNTPNPLDGMEPLERYIFDVPKMKHGTNHADYLEVALRKFEEINKFGLKSIK